MIPETVRFTGVTIPTKELLFGYGGRKVYFTPPANWMRVEFDVSDVLNGQRPMDAVDAWIEKTISGNWASHLIRHGSTIVVLFEDENDALLFKLMGGETAWKEEPQAKL